MTGEREKGGGVGGGGQRNKGKWERGVESGMERERGGRDDLEADSRRRWSYPRAASLAGYFIHHLKN